MGVERPTGRVIGGFRVGELLAGGAMGAVYSAEDADGRRVALKLLSPDLRHDERFRQRFLRESQLAATLEHPNVVKTIASGEDGGVLYLAMDYVDGVDCASSCVAKAGSRPSAQSRWLHRRARRSTLRTRPDSCIGT